MSKPQYIYVVYIQAPCEKVWDALIDPEMNKEYWGRQCNLSDWKIGSRWLHANYDNHSEVMIQGSVLERDRPHRLVLSWVRPEHADDAARTSRVTFTVEEQFGSSKLTVIHSDLDEEMHKAISGGWPPILSSLKTLLETGEAMPMTRRNWKRSA